MYISYNSLFNKNLFRINFSKFQNINIIHPIIYTLFFLFKSIGTNILFKFIAELYDRHSICLFKIQKEQIKTHFYKISYYRKIECIFITYKLPYARIQEDQYLNQFEFEIFFYSNMMKLNREK